MGGNPLAPVQYAPHDCEKSRASNCKRAGMQMDEPESCQNSPHATQRHNVHRRSTFETHGWITLIRDGPVRGASSSASERERMQNASPWRSVGSRGPEDSGEKKNPAMPGSPVEVKVHSRSIPSAMPPLPPINPSGPRPASFSSTALTNGINHSPPTLNGVPSPPQRFSNGPSSSSSSSLANQQLPATCGARQLSKLKRFLTTLQQFGNDISPEIGESVRNLVLALVNSTVTIEEFHGRLQEATNFPLRPFVIPFLKANLPLLQRELLHCARAAKQTPAQYLSQHEHLLLSTTMASPPDSSELLLETNENGKRRSPDRGKENGFHERVPVAMEPPAKRICTISPAPRHSPALSVPLPLNTQHHPTPPPLQHYALEDVTGPHNYRDPQHLLEVRDVKERPRHPGTNGGYREEPMDHRLTEREWADEWRHLDHVLNCIVDMVEKTRRSIAVLRRCQEADREEMHYWRRRSSTNGGYREEPMDHRLTEREWADEWRHLDHVLNCIVDMVEKTRRSIAVLRRCQEADREEMHYWRRRSSEHEEERKSTPSKQSSPRGGGDSVSAHRYHLCADSGGAKMDTRCPPKRVPSAACFFTLCRLTMQPPQSYSVGGQRSSGQLTGKPAGARPDYRESQFTPRSGYVPDEIWRKAEEAVNEVKRQAMGEVQKAVAEAEQKALELVTVERARMEKTLAEAKRQATKDAIQVINEQEDSSESCWNCGRKASETCSGCNAARYCGSFCQHKDWERHHLICSPGLQAQPKPPSAVPGRAAGKFPDSMATASPAMEKITTTASRASTPASVSAAETNGH
ncbi:UNVERIFIED_CONTAM: hypothetical protein FKN15_038789 [Acipenser sinensis]